jgi:hypothetical protein
MSFLDLIGSISANHPLMTWHWVTSMDLTNRHLVYHIQINSACPSVANGLVSCSLLFIIEPLPFWCYRWLKLSCYSSICWVTNSIMLITSQHITVCVCEWVLVGRGQFKVKLALCSIYSPFSWTLFSNSEWSLPKL